MSAESIMDEGGEGIDELSKPAEKAGAEAHSLTRQFRQAFVDTSRVVFDSKTKREIISGNRFTVYDSGRKNFEPDSDSSNF